MTVPDMAGPLGRKRGRPLRIDRSQILEVAKALDPQTLTMQAVADELGVDRKAINYHVTDREGLLRLVAADVFESHFADSFTTELDREELRSSGDWRNVVRAWAVAVRDSMVATGVATSYYRIDSDNPAIFEPAELFLRRLIDAGFDRLSASRGLVSLTRTAMGVGRDIVLEKHSGEHPQRPEVRRLLDGEDPNEYEGLRWLMSARYERACRHRLPVRIRDRPLHHRNGPTTRRARHNRNRTMSTETSAAETFTIDEHEISGTDAPVLVRDYRPDAATAHTAFLWVHGGGFSSGGLDQKESDAPARLLAAAGVFVRTVQYRLAPRANPWKDPDLAPHPGRFPAGLN